MAVVVSGIILKKTKFFSGDPAPFVMELPEYHMPSARNIFKATWFRCKAFIVKAGTVILLATVVIWFLKSISVSGHFVDFNADPEDSILAGFGKIIAPIFAPLGFGDWMASVATILGLVAKEVVVGTYGVLAGIGEVGAEDSSMVALVASKFSVASAFAFVFFNQLTIPCFAATGAIKEEMGSNKWFGLAIGYQLLFSYTVAFMIYQFGRIIEGGSFNLMTGLAVVVLFIYGYLLFRKDRSKLENKNFSSKENDEVVKYESN